MILDLFQGYFDNPNIDIFISIPQLFTKVSELINELFDQPEKVTERLIVTVYTEKLTVNDLIKAGAKRIRISSSHTFVFN